MSRTSGVFQQTRPILSEAWQGSKEGPNLRLWDEGMKGGPGAKGRHNGQKALCVYMLWGLFPYGDDQININECLFKFTMRQALC